MTTKIESVKRVIITTLVLFVISFSYQAVLIVLSLKRNRLLTFTFTLLILLQIIAVLLIAQTALIGKMVDLGV
jgi:hypothetical protein